MILSSGTKKPTIHSTAYVAPSAVVSGDVQIGAGCAILHGAVLSAEGASLTVGANTVVMENAVVKASGGTASQFPVAIGERCIVGPHAYIAGATIGNGCFVAAGGSLLNGQRLADNAGIGLDGRVATFLADVFNVEPGANAYGEAAELYAKALRKLHAQDTPLDAHKNLKPPPRRSGEEPPATQSTDVGGVVDAMMLELQEMEQRRQESQRKKGK
jgi:carbonic anhydrase/acetyltransferase-like protein (isoleucine patch superfamily)